MSKIYMYSDPHFGHHNLAINRGFKDSDEMDEHIITNWNKVINKRDVVWILGDITMEKNNYGILDRLNGLKNVVLGNHDRPQHIISLMEHVNKVCGAIRLKECILTHVPIHPAELRGFKYNIHGHVHGNTIDHPRYINVSCDVLGYTPVLLEEIIK